MEKDTPLFSLSAIGSPTAFSTAVKQPGSLTSRAVSNGESPFINLGAQPSPQQEGVDVNGRLSLSSTLSDKGGTQSLNNTCTSVGILDLDAMQDSSMHRFLTSPFDSHDLNLHMSSTLSTQPSGVAPAVSDNNERNHPTNGVTPYHNFTTPTTEQSLGIPQELLMQQPGSEYSMSSEGTDLFASQASPPSQYSDDENIAEAIKGALDELELTSSSIYSEEGQEDKNETSSLQLPPHTTTTSTTTTQQNAVTTNTKSQFPASLVTKENGLSDSRTPTTVGVPFSSSPVLNAHGNTSLKLDLSLGDGRETKEEKAVLVGDGDAPGDETLIGDEVEPSVMREADEFSRFDPSHLASLLEKDSFSATSPKSLPLQNGETKSAVASLSVERREGEVGVKEVSALKEEGLVLEEENKEGDVSSRTGSALSYSTSEEGGSPTHTVEGLPSALLAPTSYADDQSTLETSALLLSSLAPSPHIHQVSPLLPATTQPSSLTMSLGDSSFEGGCFEAPISAVNGEIVGDGARNSSGGVYNPFDSDDNGSVESFGQLQFGDHSADSFMAQLAKDEEEIKATHLTPSSEQFQSFTSVLSTSRFSTSLGDNLSMDAYFQKKSGKMGRLSASKLPPSERPRFSDTAGHLIESPDINQMTTASFSHVTSSASPTTRPPLEPIPEGDSLNSTLVSENSDTGQGPPTQPAAPVSSQTCSTSDDLTPLITSHSPFPAQFNIPKLDFANTSATSRHTISPTLSQPRSMGKNTLSTTSSPLLQKLSKSSPLPRTVETSSIGLPPELLKPAAADDSTTSTLVFKEVSALTLSSPPSALDPSLMSMPTPSIGKLPSFDVTSTPHIGSFSSSRDVTSPDLGLDHSLLQSLASPGKSEVLSEHAKNTTSPAKLVTGVASSAATIVSQGYPSPSENPLSTAKASPSPTKVIFSPKRRPPTTSITSERIQASPERFQVTQVLSTETLTTWSSNSPLTSPPQGLKSPPLPPPVDLTAKNAPMPSKTSGTAFLSSAHSPKTEAARKKLASLQAQLDAARFNADEFLASLKSSDVPPSSTGKSTVTSKSSPTRTSRVPVSSTTPSPRSKVSPPSSQSGAKKTSISRPNKPFMSMPANSSASKKKVATREISTSPEKKRESQSGQDTKLKAFSGHGKGDQLSKSSPTRKTARGTPTRKEAGKLHKATAKDGSKFSPSSETKWPSPSEAVKSSRIQSEASSAKKRHVHIQEPQLKSSGVKESTVMSSGGESPHVCTAASSTVDTSSSVKSTLSSLLTSHAHIFTTSPPPLSTLTMSTSPPSQGHTPPKTASSTASHSVVSIQPPPSKTPVSQSLEPPLVIKPLMKGPTLPIMKTSTVDPSVLNVPNSLCFSQVCCIGVSISDQLTITNLGERWLQLEFQAIHLYRDGTECSLSENVFSLPQRSFVGPEQQETIKVTFSPRSGGSYEAVVAVYAHLVVSSSTEKDKPVANVLVKAVAEEPRIEIQTSSSSSSAIAMVGERSESTKPRVEEEEGILSCNKRVLFWSGVELHKSVYQEVVLHNSYSVTIPLSISIRHPDSPFKLKSVGGDEIEGTSQMLSQQPSERSREVELLPGVQLPVGVVYTPTSATVSLSALDISDLLHSKKYRLRLCGYGGRGQLEVVSGRRVSGECLVDLGEITSGRKITTKISVYNSGLREAFVIATCHPDMKSSSPLPVDQVSLTPSKLIVPPQQIKDLLLIYHTDERDETHCHSYPTLLACIKLTTGDEILRQRLQKVVTRRFISTLATQHQDRNREGERRTSSKLRNASNKVFLAHFPEQEAVTSEPDFSSFELEDEEGLFEQHLNTLSVCLSGSPPTSSKGKAASTAFTVSPPPHTATARLKHKLSLSNTPPVQVLMTKSSSSLTQGFTQSILTAHTVMLPDAQIGHYSEKHLDIHNPYSSDLEWELSCNASPFMRKGGGRKRPGSREKGAGGGIFKANYSVFWVSERRGVTQPQSTSKVPILFQPHDAGSFSQIWELKVYCDEIGVKKLRVSFGGKALANLSTETQQESHEVARKSHDHPSKSHADRTEQITKWLSQTRHHLPTTESTAVVSSTTTATPLRKTVYIKDERVVFPPTKVGSKSTIKVRVCNRGPQRYQFDVIKPAPPFSVDHHNFELGSRQCARLPIHFSPTTHGEYAGVLAIRTNAGHQAFTELRGKSLS